MCTVKENPLDYLEYANSLHKNLQFTLETPNGSVDLAFLDLNMNINEDRKISCYWYQKSTDTGIILNFRSCAPLQHKKNVIQVTVHRIFNATSDWECFDVALKKNRKIWTENQYQTEWSSSIVNEKLDKTVTREKVTAKSSPPPKKKWRKSQNLKVLKIRSLNWGFLCNTEEILLKILKRNWKKLCVIHINFTTRRLRTCLPTLKSSYDKNPKSHVVYKGKCNGCSPIYVGQTSRYVTTRISEHQKKDFPVGQYVVECCDTAHYIEWGILDTSRGIEKLMTIEAIYIKMLKPQSKTHDDYRGRELTLEY